MFKPTNERGKPMNRKNLIAIALLGVCFAFSPATADAGPALAKRIRAIAQDVVNKQPAPVGRIVTVTKQVGPGKSVVQARCPGSLHPVSVQGGVDDHGSVSYTALAETGPVGNVVVDVTRTTIATAQVFCAPVNVDTGRGLMVPVR